jgi:hypothetical protein
MSDDRLLTEIEDRLRDAGPPPEPPAHFHALAREAALGTPPVVTPMRSVVHPRGRIGRFTLAAAVLVASAAAALIIGVGGRSTTVISTVSMRGATPATGATIQFLESSGAVRPVVVKIWGLKPAPKGSYYQLWMDPGGGAPTAALVAFNTEGDGTVEARTAMPSRLGWARCWVTLETGGAESTVMRS